MTSGNIRSMHLFGWKAAVAVSLTVGVVSACLSTGASAAAGAYTPGVASAALATVQVSDSNKISVDSAYSSELSAFNGSITPGYGSALTYLRTLADGSVEYYALTDRGPNADGPNVVVDGKTYTSKFFLTPDYTPGIGIIRVSADGTTAELVDDSVIKLKDKSGNLLNGKPYTSTDLDTNGVAQPSSSFLASTSEFGLLTNLEYITGQANPNVGTDTDISGFDAEGLAVTYENGEAHFWVSDEYGPYVTEFDSTGKEIKTYKAGDGLPSVLLNREPNRGLEDLSVTPSGKIVTVEQSVLNIDSDGDGNVDKDSKKTPNFIRITVLDPTTNTYKMYGYPVAQDNGDNGITYKKVQDVKLGDVVALSDTDFLILEQGKDKKTGTVRHIVYRVSLDGASELPDDLSAEKDSSTYTMAKKTFLFDLDTIEAKDANGNTVKWSEEKAEGITVLPDMQTIAIVNDNDFQAGVTIANNNGLTDSDADDITEYTLTYNSNGSKTWSFDGSDLTTDPTITFSPNTEQNNIITIKLDQPLVDTTDSSAASSASDSSSAASSSGSSSAASSSGSSSAASSSGSSSAASSSTSSASNPSTGTATPIVPAIAVFSLACAGAMLAIGRKRK